MSFIIHQTEEEQSFSPEFAPIIKQLADLQVCYETSKNSALTTRMEMIGLCEEQKALYPQRSPEARFINQGYKDNEWSDATISKNYKAFKFRKTLLEKGVDLFKQLADGATYTQLFELALADDNKTTTVYDAAQHLKKFGKVPTKNQIVGHKLGHTDSNFVFFSSINAERKKEESESVPRDKLETNESESVPAEKLNPEPRVNELHSSTNTTVESYLEDPVSEEPVESKVNDDSSSNSTVENYLEDSVSEESVEPHSTVENTIDITAAANAIEAEAEKPGPGLSMSPVAFTTFVEEYIKTNEASWSDREQISVAIAGKLLLRAVGRPID